MRSKMISFSIPEELLPAIDEAASREHRSRAELIRDAVRQYLSSGKGRTIPLDNIQPDEREAAERGRAQFERGEFVRLDDLQRELGLPTRQGG